MKPGTIFLVLGAFLVLVAGSLFFFESVTAPESLTEEEPSREVVPLSAFEIEVVATPEARARGLSGRRDVPERYGMLFVFSSADRYGFWMKDMYVPIDIIWLREDGTIIGIEEALSPSSYPASVYSPEPVRFVLETKAGEARKSGWDVGTKLDISNY